MQAVNELKAHWSSKLSNAGWKKISPAFVKMVLSYSMALDSKLEAKIKQWVVEHKRMALESMSLKEEIEEGKVNDQLFKAEIKDNQVKGALNGSKKEWNNYRDWETDRKSVV